MASKVKLAGLVAAAAVGLSAMTGAAAGGVNVLPNGDFANSLTGWQWTPNGKAEVNDSGTLVLANVFDELSEDSMTSVYQCIPVSDTKNYHFFGAVYIPSGQERHGYARLVTTFYPTNNCNGVPLDIHKSEPFHTTGEWLTDSGDLIRTDPKTAYSLKVELIVKKDSTEQASKQYKAFLAKFDNIKVMQTGKPAGNPGLPSVGSDDAPKPPAKQPTIVPPVVKDPGSPTPPAADKDTDGTPVTPPAADDDGAAETPGAGSETPAADDQQPLGDGSEPSPVAPDTDSPAETNDDAASDGGADGPTSQSDGSSAPIAPGAPATGNSSAPTDTGEETVAAATGAGEGSAVAMVGFAGMAAAGLLGMVFIVARRRRK